MERGIDSAASADVRIRRNEFRVPDQHLAPGSAWLGYLVCRGKGHGSYLRVALRAKEFARRGSGQNSSFPLFAWCSVCRHSLCSKAHQLKLTDAACCQSQCLEFALPRLKTETEENQDTEASGCTSRTSFRSASFINSSISMVWSRRSIGGLIIQFLAKDI